MWGRCGECEEHSSLEQRYAAKVEEGLSRSSGELWKMCVWEVWGSGRHNSLAERYTANVEEDMSHLAIQTHSPSITPLPLSLSRTSYLLKLQRGGGA